MSNFAQLVRSASIVDLLVAIGHPVMALVEANGSLVTEEHPQVRVVEALALKLRFNALDECMPYSLRPVLRVNVQARQLT